MNYQRIREEIQYRVQENLEGKRYSEERTDENRIKQIESFHTIIKNLCRKMITGSTMNLSYIFTMDICTIQEYDDKNMNITPQDFQIREEDVVDEEFADESFRSYYGKVLSSLPYMLKISNIKNYDGCIMSVKIKNLDEPDEDKRINETLTFYMDSKGFLSVGFYQSLGIEEKNPSSELSIYGKFLKDDMILGHIMEQPFLSGLMSDIMTLGTESFTLQYSN